jgi:hypothetical protein
VNGSPAQVTWSQDRKYRYVWRLSWDPKKRPLLVAALIPSYADETRADRTVQYCLDVAAAKGYGELVVVNLFARYETPRDKQADRVDVFDLVGKDNDRHISAEARVVSERGGTIVAAWGADGWSRHGRVRSLLCQRADELWCFGTKDRDGRTANGFPCHPGRQGALRVQPGAVALKRFCSCLHSDIVPRAELIRKPSSARRPKNLPA